jgi:hypothetical protein
MEQVKNTFYLVLFEADCLEELYGKLSLKGLRINIFPLLKLLKLAKQKRRDIIIM